jgi:hypothetical protein
MGKALFGLMTAAAIMAATPQTASAADPAPVVGWDEFVSTLRDLPAKLLAKLPEPMRNDLQVQQEVGRLVLESLASGTLETLGGDGDHPVFLPQIGQVINVGQPNADTVYRIARVKPEGSYRIRGHRGAIRMFNVSQAGLAPGEPGFVPGTARQRDALDLNAVKVDAQGNFDVLISPQKPADYRGDWWQMHPGTVRLLVRMVSSDWSKEQSPTLSIERVDGPATRPRPSAAQLEERLRRLPATTTFMAQLFIDHVDALRREGYVNKLKVFDVSQMGGLAGQSYYEGAYDLKDDEALIVETKAPAKCTYRSLILTNALYETTDWYNNHSSLNDSQSTIDKDGVLRVVVSAKDPGVENWVDTAGYPVGVIQGRWFGCDSTPVPSVRKVAVADVQKLLPPETKRITPTERDRLVRTRRAELQQRPLW